MTDEIVEVYGAAEIAERIKELALEIGQAYEERDFTVLGVLSSGDLLDCRALLFDRDHFFICSFAISDRFADFFFRRAWSFNTKSPERRRQFPGQPQTSRQ